MSISSVLGDLQISALHWLMLCGCLDLLLRQGWHQRFLGRLRIFAEYYGSLEPDELQLQLLSPIAISRITLKCQWSTIHTIDFLIQLHGDLVVVDQVRLSIHQYLRLLDSNNVGIFLLYQLPAPTTRIFRGVELES